MFVTFKRWVELRRILKESPGETDRVVNNTRCLAGSLRNVQCGQWPWGEEPVSYQLDLMANISPKQQVFGRSEALLGRGVGWGNDGTTRP